MVGVGEVRVMTTWGVTISTRPSTKRALLERCDAAEEDLAVRCLRLKADRANLMPPVLLDVGRLMVDTVEELLVEEMDDFLADLKAAL